MKNIKKILFVVLFGLLTFSSFAVNMEDTEKAENGQEFMQIFMTNVEYEPRFLAWQNSLKNIIFRVNFHLHHLGRERKGGC